MTDNAVRVRRGAPIRTRDIALPRLPQTGFWQTPRVALGYPAESRYQPNVSELSPMSRLPQCFALVPFAFCLATIAAPVAGQREARVPDAKAPPQKVFKATSKGELDYTWSVPKGYAKKGKKHSLTVICHGTGLDHRWGHANNPVNVFRTNDVVVSVDGTSPGANGTPPTR